MTMDFIRQPIFAGCSLNCQCSMIMTATLHITTVRNRARRTSCRLTASPDKREIHLTETWKLSMQSIPCANAV